MFTFLVRVWLNKVDPFDVFVDTANTLSISNLNTDEALVTPRTAPGVLNLPVVGEILLVSVDPVDLASLVVPPLSDLEFARGLGVGVGLILVLIGVADECHSMIESRTTFIGLLYNTAGVELEGGLTGIDSHSEGLLLQLGLHIGDSAVDLSVLLDLAHRLIFLVSAFALFFGLARCVGVVCVGHGALVMHEVPSVAHPAALASICAVVLAEFLFVIWVSGECAVDDLLFGEVHWGFVRLDSDGTLKSSRGGEGPTGTARSLVLNANHLAVISPIDIGGSVGLSEHIMSSVE